jgi:multidrug efflux pump
VDVAPFGNRPRGIKIAPDGKTYVVTLENSNNLLLLDAGFKPMDAIIRTGIQRMRPVLLTTWTAIFGLLPLMYKFDVNFFSRTIQFGGPSADWWVPLATAIVYGLGFSTALTLLVTPALLAIEQKYFAKGKRHWGQMGRMDDLASPVPAE